MGCIWLFDASIYFYVCYSYNITDDTVGTLRSSYVRPNER